jgi:hypothetical protein
MELEKYSIGVGDRFGQQAEAQLRACVRAVESGVLVVPVWNKSHREHGIIGSEPSSTRRAADAAVKALGWNHPYHVDADHVRLETVDRFLPCSDYYTIDVGDAIGRPMPDAGASEFMARHAELLGPVSIGGMEKPLRVSRSELERIVKKYLSAVREAGEIYRRILSAKGEGNFITEISMDETDEAQTPQELLVILAALADEGVRVQTIAPKFIGRFNKGIDYAGDVAQFAQQFNEDVAVIAFAVKHYPLPAKLKLSVHSGSDKFSLYRSMRAALTRFDAGLHIKTAGTTWLEELLGLAEADGEGCALVSEVYSIALQRIDELCEPYASVIEINRKVLPPRRVVENWDSQQWLTAITHAPRNPAYNPDMRQLLHVGYKIAAEMGTRYLAALARHRPLIAARVTANLYEKHIKPLFVGA